MLGPGSSRLIQILKDSSSTTLATASRFPPGERAGNPKYMPGQSGSTGCALPSRVTHTSSCSPCPVPVAYTSDPVADTARSAEPPERSEEHTSELQSRSDLVCRLLLEKKTAKNLGLDRLQHG